MYIADHQQSKSTNYTLSRCISLLYTEQFSVGLDQLCNDGRGRRACSRLLLCGKGHVEGTSCKSVVAENEFPCGLSGGVAIWLCVGTRDTVMLEVRVTCCDGAIPPIFCFGNYKYHTSETQIYK
jgi:hypothetical protein